MRTVFIGIVAVLLSIAPSVAQQNPPPSNQKDQTPVFRKNVNVVNVFFR